MVTPCHQSGTSRPISNMAPLTPRAMHMARACATTLVRRRSSILSNDVGAGAGTGRGCASEGLGLSNTLHLFGQLPQHTDGNEHRYKCHPKVCRGFVARCGQGAGCLHRLGIFRLGAGSGVAIDRAHGCEICEHGFLVSVRLGREHRPTFFSGQQKFIVARARVVSEHW